MSWLVFTLQAIAWPSAASWVAWLAFRSVQEYARVVAQESKDATLTSAAARAEQALREVNEARAVWEAAAATTTEELSVLKGALLER